MLKIAKQTKLNPEKVINRASNFFGKGGWGLDEKGRNQFCISFEGGGGHVTISIVDQEEHCEVTADTREFEHPVRQFLEKI